MESKINESFEYSEKEDNISWEEIYDKIPKVLKMIKQILLTKSEDNDSNINIFEFLKDFDLEIKAEEPYIMKESDFDNTNFYKYILKVAIYYLKQENINAIINKLYPSIYKHLIDLIDIIQMILNEKKNYEKNDVKYYIYHIINAFSDTDTENKLENDFKFLKCGIELLLKEYNINNYVEYFSEKDKTEIRKNFCLSLKNLLVNIQQYMLNNKYLESENKSELLNKINELCRKARELSERETDIHYIENYKSILGELYDSLVNEINFKSIYKFIDNFIDEIPENINDFYYSIFCFHDIKKFEKKIGEMSFIDEFRKNYICDSNTNNSFLKYYIQFIKKKKMFNKLISGTNSNKKYFEELLKDEKFRKKIINFYKSQTIRDFINEKCDINEKDKLLEKLPYLLELMEKDDFWKQIMLFPMAKHKMASVENYLRIVINTEYVKYHNTQENKKITILNLLLFELLIHEIFHFLRRLIFLGKKAKDAITPPSSYNKDEKENEEDCSTFQQENKEVKKSLNEEKQHGEIGQRLIHYVFNMDKIVFISYAAGKIFETFTLKDEKEIKILKKIIYKEDTSYATFTFTKIVGVVHKIYNCCCKSDC